MPVCTHACVSACVCARVEFTAERAAFVWPVPRRDCDVLGDSSFEADLLWRPVCQTLETAALLSLSGSHSDRGPRARRGPGPQVGLSSLPPPAPAVLSGTSITHIRPHGRWVPGLLKRVSEGGRSGSSHECVCLSRHWAHFWSLFFTSLVTYEGYLCLHVSRTM